MLFFTLCSPHLDSVYPISPPDYLHFLYSLYSVNQPIVVRTGVELASYLLQFITKCFNTWYHSTTWLWLSVSPDRHPHSEGISLHCEAGLAHNQSRTRTEYRSRRNRQPYNVSCPNDYGPWCLQDSGPSLITPIWLLVRYLSLPKCYNASTGFPSTDLSSFLCLSLTSLPDLDSNQGPHG